tara:strand:- start:700 stop:885 length:186 start_codon:yes stop_codon:yes gene_type:complete
MVVDNDLSSQAITSACITTWFDDGSDDSRFVVKATMAGLCGNGSTVSLFFPVNSSFNLDES